jgi:ABC-type antimicrobial peptide transport system, permease component
MGILDNLQIALNALRINKMRSILTMLGIIIGVAAVITMLAVGRGAQGQILNQIKSMGTNLIIILPGATLSSGARSGAGSSQSLTEADAYAIRREIPSVVASAPTLRTTSQMIAANSNWSTSVYGSNLDYFTARDLEIADGRSFEDAELVSGQKVVVIGQTIATELFGEENPLGETIRISKTPFLVIGVLVSKGQSSMGTDSDDLAIVPIKAMRSYLMGQTPGRVGKVWQIAVKVEDGYDMYVAQEEIEALLRQRHRITDGKDDDFTVRNLSELLDTVETSTKVLTYLLGAIASISLLVGGIGIMNIMLVSVTERTREIGLRMAIGAKTRDILTQFLVEAFTLSLLGCAIGIILGSALSFTIGQVATFQPEVTGSSILLSTSFAAAIGIFFGFYPARKASRLLPVDALRHE